MRILRNAPIQSDYQNALKREGRQKRGELVVYFNGWIGETRGAPIFLKIMQEANTRGIPIKMLVAGRLAGVSSLALAELPNVTYYGNLDLPDALELYRDADVALIYYDPNVEINRLAESNKWGDCVFLNTPFITNSEVKTADQFFHRGAAIPVPYSDDDGLLRTLVGLIERPARLIECREALQQFESEYKPFDAAFGALLDSLVAKVVKHNGRDAKQ